MYKNKENISQLKKQLQNVEEALEATRQSSKNEEHKSNQLLAEKVHYMMHCCVALFRCLFCFSVKLWFSFYQIGELGKKKYIVKYLVLNCRFPLEDYMYCGYLKINLHQIFPYNVYEWVLSD